MLVYLFLSIIVVVFYYFLDSFDLYYLKVRLNNKKFKRKFKIKNISCYRLVTLFIPLIYIVFVILLILFE